MNVLKGECVLCVLPIKKSVGFWVSPPKTDFTTIYMIHTFHDHPDHPLKSFSLIILFLLLNKVGRKEVPYVTYNERIWT
jgi:hypothetical protein